MQKKLGQRERIRTSDPYHPKVVRYQAALHAEVQDYSRANYFLRSFTVTSARSGAKKTQNILQFTPDIQVVRNDAFDACFFSMATI